MKLFSAFYAGGNADGPDGPTFEVSNVAGGIDYDSAFRDMPPPQVLPTAIATKIAAAPPALTTRPPPTTRKPPKSKMKSLLGYGIIHYGIIHLSYLIVCITDVASKKKMITSYT